MNFPDESLFLILKYQLLTIRASYLASISQCLHLYEEKSSSYFIQLLLTPIDKNFMGFWSFWCCQEIVADPGIETPETAIAKQMMRQHVRNLLKILKPRERFIVQYRFGIDCDERKSLSEIGAMYDISKERVRQLESQALVKLKRCLLGQGLDGYLDLLIWVTDQLHVFP